MIRKYKKAYYICKTKQKKLMEKVVAVFFKMPMSARNRLKEAARKTSQERGYRVSMTQLLLEYIESL
jgi:hypothetical protein